MAETKAKYWTEHEVFRRLEKVFPAPAHVLLSQVRNGTGYSRRARTADALVASVWPSRGLHLIGVEIKVSRSDWLKELRSPEKSTSIQNYCRHWYVATPPGIVEPGTLPTTWGLIEVSDKRTKIVTPAPTLEPQPLDMLFLCSVLRAVAEQSVAKRELQRMVEERVEEKLAFEAEIKGRELRDLKERIELFEKASGVKLETYQEGRIGKAVAMVRQAQGPDLLAALERLAQSAAMVARLAEEAVKVGDDLV